MHTGRNDPCPCGSGKKYKKCCLPRDKEKEDSQIKALQAKNAALGLEPVSRAPGAVLIPPGPELPDDPETAALDALWDEFEAADYAGRIALFCKGMEEPDLIDADMAFEMLSLIHNLAVARDERDRFAAFVAALRERCPDCYENSASYYLCWLIEDRLALGRWEELTPLTSELAGRACKDIDLFNRVLDVLAYHGQLARLVEMMRIAWPEVNSSDNVVPWGVSEFADRATRYEIFAYLEQDSTPQGDDPALIERISFYIEEPIIEYLRRDVTHLSGRSGRAWMLKDFEMRPPRKSRRDRDDDPASLNLYLLSLEFVGDQHRQAGVPYTRLEQARKNLIRYLRERHAGKLEERKSMLESMRQRHPRSKPRPRPPEHPLCPDRATLDRFLADMLDILSWRQYEVAATFELVPAWLSFLESRQLVDADRRHKTIAELSALHADLLKLYSRNHGDPTLKKAMESWPNQLV